MDTPSDDDFDHVRDFDLSDPDSESEHVHDTPSTTPPRTQTPRPTDRKIIPCPYENCSKTFNRNARLQEHLRSHTGERPFQCDQEDCDKSFLRESHLQRHKKSAHSDIRDYNCTWPDCDKSFATGTRLRRHIASHEGKEKYKCRDYEGCNETFRKHETLKKHILTVHHNQDPFPCDQTCGETGGPCTKTFKTAEKLRNHQRAVHDASRFSCIICLGAVENLSVTDNLPHHEASSHTFSTFSELQAHIAEVHPPTCQYCPISFKTNKELKRHLELQHGVLDMEKSSQKQFPCPHTGCKQVFTKQGNLNVHIKTVHEQKKDFVCGQTEVPVPSELEDTSQIYAFGCGRSFTSKATLIEHIRVTHFNLPSKRTLRDAKRKTKRSAEDDISSTSSVKKRAPRKDKGVKKISTLSALTGLKLKADSSAYATQSEYLPYAPTAYDDVKHRPTAPNSYDHAADDKEDEWNQLSGSMTMIGEHLYHNGKGYHLVSEDGSADQAILEDPQYIPCGEMTTRVSQGWEDDMEPPFYFEHEPEYIHTTKTGAIDPQLLRA